MTPAVNEIDNEIFLIAYEIKIFILDISERRCYIPQYMTPAQDIFYWNLQKSQLPV